MSSALLGTLLARRMHALGLASIPHRSGCRVWSTAPSWTSPPSEDRAVDKAVGLIEVPQPTTHRLSLDESIASSPAHASTGRLLSQWANDHAGIHDVRRIKGGLDPAHRRDTPDITVPFHKMAPKTADR
jgi:hypothetical protein